MGLSEWAGRGDGHPGEWGLVLSLEDQRSVGYLLQPLLPSVFAQTWVETINEWERTVVEAGLLGNEEHTDGALPWPESGRIWMCFPHLEWEQRHLDAFFSPGFLGLQDWFSALLIRLFFPCTTAPSPWGDAHHSSLWNFQRPCKTHSAAVSCRFHLLYVLCIINLFKGSHWTFTFVTVT